MASSVNPWNHDRWKFAWDMNADGLFTISDVVPILKWAFFLPGDAALAGLLSWAPGAARFLELSISNLGTFWPGLVSAVVWLALVGLWFALDS